MSEKTQKPKKWGKTHLSCLSFDLHMAKRGGEVPY